MIKKHFKKLVSLALTAVMVMGMATTASAEETASQNDMGNPSVYLSATDKLTFAKEMDELYAKQSLLRSSPTPTREIVDALLLQVPNATPEEKAAINAELETYGVYEFEAPVIESASTCATDSGDVALDTPTIYYESWSKNWSVTCGGHWKNNEYGDSVGNVGGADGFGVGYTNSSNKYSSKVMSASAYMTDVNSNYRASTSNRSDGDGSKGFGFRIQDHWKSGYYVGHKWSGLCTYDRWFGNYNGVATAYYIHTYDSASLESVSFGFDGKTAGISADITNSVKSFTAFSADKSFGVYP